MGLCIGRGEFENRRWGKRKKNKRVGKERDDHEREGKKEREKVGVSNPKKKKTKVLCHLTLIYLSTC